MQSLGQQQPLLRRGAKPNGLPPTYLPALRPAGVTHRAISDAAGPITAASSPKRFSAYRTAARYVVASAAAAAQTSLYTSVSKGMASPLGPSKQGTAVNFALFSQHASGVALVLKSETGGEAIEVPLDAKDNRTGDVWHVQLEGLPTSGVLYGFRCALLQQLVLHTLS